MPRRRKTVSLDGDITEEESFLFVCNWHQFVSPAASAERPKLMAKADASPANAVQ